MSATTVNPAYGMLDRSETKYAMRWIISWSIRYRKPTIEIQEPESIATSYAWERGMPCLQCQHENALDAKFSNQCGASLTVNIVVQNSSQSLNRRTESESHVHELVLAAAGLLQRNHLGHRENAMTRLEESLAISTELGMPPLMEPV